MNPQADTQRPPSDFNVYRHLSTLFPKHGELWAHCMPSRHLWSDPISEVLSEVERRRTVELVPGCGETLKQLGLGDSCGIPPGISQVRPPFFNTKGIQSSIAFEIVQRLPRCVDPMSAAAQLNEAFTYVQRVAQGKYADLEANQAGTVRLSTISAGYDAPHQFVVLDRHISHYGVYRKYLAVFGENGATAIISCPSAAQLAELIEGNSALYSQLEKNLSRERSKFSLNGWDIPVPRFAEQVLSQLRDGSYKTLENGASIVHLLLYGLEFELSPMVRSGICRIVAQKMNAYGDPIFGRALRSEIPANCTEPPEPYLRPGTVP